MTSDNNEVSKLLKKNKENLYFSMSAKTRSGLLDFIGRHQAKDGFRFSSYQLVAASFLCGLVAATIWFNFFSNKISNENLVIQEIVSGHVRSMMVAHFSDVASTDQHTVKPWFEGKLDFSPSVKDLTKEGFPLVGGRLDYINSRPVAALNYRHNQHLINIFEWPATIGDTTPQLTSQRGFQLYHYIKSGMEYWIISDLNAAELQRFVNLL